MYLGAIVQLQISILNTQRAPRSATSPKQELLQTKCNGWLMALLCPMLANRGFPKFISQIF